jgi:hypothetical protein
MASWTVRTLVVGSLVVACAGGEPPIESSWRSARELRVPPKPGSSITHTKMCECQACEPAACCQGTEYEEPSGEKCDSYDFTQACGMSVRSCKSRCFLHVWRVKQTESCDERPSACCS